MVQTSQQYEEIFDKLNVLFLNYSTQMTALDTKRQKVIDLMKSIHNEYKLGKVEEDNVEDVDIDDEDNDNVIFVWHTSSSSSFFSFLFLFTLIFSPCPLNF